MDTFYDFSLKHGLLIVLNSFVMLFILFIFHEIHVYCKQNFSERSKIASSFLTDCLATLTGKDKEYALVICNHGTQSRRGAGDLAVFEIFHCLRSAKVITGVCLI